VSNQHVVKSMSMRFNTCVSSRHQKALNGRAGKLKLRTASHSTAAATSQMRNVPYVFMYDCRRVACKQVFGGLVSEPSKSLSGATAEQPASLHHARNYLSHWLTINHEIDVVRVLVCLYTCSECALCES
jgi:hypothetical protein